MGAGPGKSTQMACPLVGGGWGGGVAPGQSMCGGVVLLDRVRNVFFLRLLSQLEGTLS